jgi:hypothetical protein
MSCRAVQWNAVDDESDKLDLQESRRNRQLHTSDIKQDVTGHINSLEFENKSLRNEIEVMKRQQGMSGLPSSNSSFL